MTIPALDVLNELPAPPAPILETASGLRAQGWKDEDDIPEFYTDDALAAVLAFLEAMNR